MRKNPQKPTKTNGRTKGEKIVTLLQRNTGASIAELAKATGWQRHSVHGFMSGTLKKKQGLEINNSKEDNNDRRYRIAAGAQ
jgi:DNA-binding IclR family transcriptional regulator